MDLAVEQNMLSTMHFFGHGARLHDPFFCPTNIKEILKTHSGLVSHSLI